MKSVGNIRCTFERSHENVVVLEFRHEAMNALIEMEDETMAISTFHRDTTVHTTFMGQMHMKGCELWSIVQLY